MRVYTGCTDVREDFSALLDDELAVDEREAIEAHLSECSDCLRALDGMKRVDVLFRAAPAVEAPPDLESRLRDVTKPRLLRFPKGFASLNRGASMMAAAAALILVAGVSFLTMRGSGAPESEMGHVAQGSQPEPAPVMQSGGRDTDTATVSDTMPVEQAPAVPEPLTAEEVGREPAEAAREMQRRAGGMELTDVAALRNEAASDRDRQAPAAAPPPAAEAAPAPMDETVRYEEILSAEPRARAADESTEAKAAGEGAAANAAQKAASADAPRTLERRDGVWYEAAYAGEPVTDIRPNDERFGAMIAKDAALRRYLQLSDPVVFRYEDTWYKLLPTE